VHDDHTLYAEDLEYLIYLLRGHAGPAGPTGPAGATGPAGPGSGAAFTFTFATPSPVNLGAIPAGAIMNRVSVLITTAFDDPSATLELGTFGGSPSAFLAPSDSKLGAVGQYETDMLVTVAAPDALKLTISPGASTQGAGVLFYNLLP
jgi:hypothetical protein